MSDDPIARCYKLIEQIIDELRKIQVPIPRPEHQQDNQPKLSPREVDNILDLHRRGLSYSEIADIYDVHRTTIARQVKKHKRGK